MANQPSKKNKQNLTSEEDKTTKSSPKNGNETKANNSEFLDKLELLQSRFDGDLNAISIDDALELVDEWHDLLHKQKEPEVKEIASHLKQLSKLLKSDKTTGSDISEALMQIGEASSNFATDADKEVKSTCRKLGKHLSKLGNSLAKAEEHEQIEEIDSLVEVLEEDVTQVEGETALSAVDNWYSVLHKSEDENLKEIANGLKELKQLLKRSKPNSSEIREILHRLGEQTQQAGEEAKRGFKGPIQRLGKILVRTSKSLEE
jgi:ABC-type transporter Mla subunit MlaD